MGAYPWLWLDKSSYHDAKLAASRHWPDFLYAWMGVNATNQAPNHAPPDWWHEAGTYSLLGEYHPIPVAFLNSKQEQRQRQLLQMGPRDQTAQQSAALQAALAASLRAASGGR